MEIGILLRENVFYLLSPSFALTKARKDYSVNLKLSLFNRPENFSWTRASLTTKIARSRSVAHSNGSQFHGTQNILHFLIVNLSLSVQISLSNLNSNFFLNFQILKLPIMSHFVMNRCTICGYDTRSCKIMSTNCVKKTKQ